MLAKACLDTHAPLASPTPIKAAAASLNFGASSDDEQGEEDEPGNIGNDDAMLIDNSFLAKKNLHKDAAAAADESLIRVLESGPSLLEAVKEAVGALKALIPGVLHSFASLLVPPHHACLRCAQPPWFRCQPGRLPRSLTACMPHQTVSSVWLVRLHANNSMLVNRMASQSKMICSVVHCVTSSAACKHWAGGDRVAGVSTAT